MNTKKLLMIGAGAVVLYFVWKKFGTSTETEETAGASGLFKRTDPEKMFGNNCYCQGRYNGKCYTPNCCERKCRKKILATVNQ